MRERRFEGKARSFPRPRQPNSNKTKLPIQAIVRLPFDVRLQSKEELITIEVLIPRVAS